MKSSPPYPNGYNLLSGQLGNGVIELIDALLDQLVVILMNPCRIDKMIEGFE
jgi:hypothetical protein